MKKGLVFGKFLPLHKGHLALIEFALKHCDHLYVVICFSGKEPIDYITRKQWLYEALAKYSNVNLVSFGYDEKLLPNTSVSSREVSKAWAQAFKKLLPDVTIVFTSEPYGEYVAGYMGIQHLSFNEQRNIVPVSATQIRNDPFKYWDFIPEHTRYWFVKKIALVGTESTGKSMLAEKLASFFNTAFVPEMAREIVETTSTCTFDDLKRIAERHASAINEKLPAANKILIVDTDITITKSYSLFLFQKELVVEPWVEEANRFDLYLFLEPDCEYVQDGTRLSQSERAGLSDHHKTVFNHGGISFVSISGDWEERFQQAIQIIETRFLK